MGDFSVSCVITNTSLQNDKVVLIPLAPARYTNRRNPSFSGGDAARGGSLIISNEGPCCYFEPVTLPIMGEVDSYGSFDSIEENAHTAYLEEKTGMKIADLAEAAIRGFRAKRIPYFAKSAKIMHWKGDKRKPWNGVLWGSFVARSAWDVFSMRTWDPYTGKEDHTAFTDAWVGPEVLKGLGFVRGKTDKKRAIELLGDGNHEGPRHHTPWTHPAVPGLVAWSDEHMSCEYLLDDKKITTKKIWAIYHPAELQKALTLKGLSLPEEALRWARETTVGGVGLAAAHVTYKRNARMDRYFRKSHRDDPQMTFRQISDSTPDDLMKVYQDALQARIQRYIKGDHTAETISVPMPEDGVTQVYCDGKFHVKVKGDHAGLVGTEVSVGPCDGEKHEDLYRPRVLFPEIAWEELRAQEWKPKIEHHFMRFSTSDQPYLRRFAPEMLRLYGKHLFTTFRPQAEALLMFSRNLDDGNRIFMPTNTGRQYGAPKTQGEIARVARSLIAAKKRR